MNNDTVEGTIDQFKCDFITTSKIHEIISIAAIMASFQKFFSYGRIILQCGINNVHFMGIREDWVKLLSKLQNLRQYTVTDEFIQYINHVEVILNQFINTYDKKVDINFWNSICALEHIRETSGFDMQTNIEGWLTHFYGFYGKVPISLFNEFTNTKKELNLYSRF